MSCYEELALKDNVFSVILRARDPEKDKLYCFFGEDRKKGKFIKKLEKGEALSDQELTKLKKRFPEQAETWAKFGAKGKFRIVKDVVKGNDTLLRVKEKIFVYLSNRKKDIFYPERNLQLWIEDPKSGEKRIVGVKYTGGTGEPYEPIIFTKKPKVKKGFLTEFGTVSNSYKIVNEDRYLIRDLLEPNEIFINCYPLQRELDFLKEKKIKLDDLLTNGYILLHFPDPKIEYTLAQLKDLYATTKEKIERDNYLSQMVEDNVPEKKGPVSDCFVFSFKIVANDKTDLIPYIDLLQIFYYLKNRVSFEMPLIIYQDRTWNAPNVVVHKGSVRERRITQNKILDYTIDLPELRRTGNTVFKDYSDRIVIRLFNYTLKGKASSEEDKYVVLSISNTGRIEVYINYVESKKAKLTMVDAVIKNIKDLIEGINKNVDYRLNNNIPKDKKIVPPDVFLTKNRFELSENCEIDNMTWVSFYKGKIENNKDLQNLDKMFYPFLESVTDMKNPEVYLMRYKKVSNFKSMSEIFQKITDWKDTGKSDVFIVNKIKIEHNQTDREAQNTLQKWKQNFLVRTEEGVKIRQGGISIRLHLEREKVVLFGIKEFQDLLDCYRFMSAFLNIYFNIDKHLKNRQFKKILSNPKRFVIEDDEQMIDEEGLLQNILGEIDYDLEFDETNGLELDLDMDLDIDESETVPVGDGEAVEVEVGGPDEDLFPHMKHQGFVETRYQLKCSETDEDLLHDTCEDICDDNNYFLRRLQRRDDAIFSYYGKDDQDTTYARICQNKSQPIIMDYDPEENKEIDRKTYTYAMKYGSDDAHQFWYICPKAWCPIHEKPYNLEDIKKKEYKKTARVGGDCFVGKCPDGDHQVFWRDNDMIYPGFNKSQKTPDGKCIPCCYKNDKRETLEYKACTGQLVSVDADEDVGNILYIIDYKPSRVIPFRRYGTLPEYVSKLFQCRCDSGTMERNRQCYFLKGIKPTKKHRSFLGAVADLISKDKDDTLTVGQILTVLNQKLDEKLFNSLANGVLKITFDDPSKKDAYNAFMEYINDETKYLKPEYLWDLVSRPGVLTDDGFNLVILSQDSISCPLGEYIERFYDLDRNYAFLFNQNGYFMPIYKVKNNNSILEQRGWFNAKKDMEVERINSIIQENCSQKYLSMETVLKENMEEYGIKYNLDAKRENSLDEVEKEVKKVKAKIKEQVVDKYNHAVAVILDNGLYVPIKPTGSYLKYPTRNQEDTPYLSYDKTLKLLREVAKKTSLNVAPYGKMLSGKGVNGILVETDRTVPVNRTGSVPSDSLVVSYYSFYPDADGYLMSGKEIPDERQIEVAKHNFEEETYQRLKFEISKWLKSKRDYAKKIKKVIDDEKASLKKKREDLEKILSDIFKKLVSTTGVKIDIKNYVVPNIRKECSKDPVAPHCTKSGKLYIHPKNLINGKNNLFLYKSRLSDELIRNTKIRDDILLDAIQYIVDRKQVEETKGALVIHGDTLLEDIRDIYTERSDFYISPYVPFDKQNPSDVSKLYGDDNVYLSVEDLNPVWISVLCSEYTVHNNGCGGLSLFCAMSESINYVRSIAEREEGQRAKRYTERDLREKVVQILKKLAMRGVVNLSKSLEVELSDSQMKQKEQEIILDLFSRFKGKNFRDMLKLEEYIMSDEYEGGLIDAFLLASHFEQNIAILDKYIKEKDMIYLETGGKYITLLYRDTSLEQGSSGDTFGLVQRGDQKAFTENELTTDFVEKIQMGKRSDVDKRTLYIYKKMA